MGLARKMLGLRFGPLFLATLLVLQDSVEANTFIPVPLLSVTTPVPSLFQKPKSKELQVTRYAADQSSVQRNSRASNPNCGRCDDWPPPRRSDDRFSDRNDRYDRERYPDNDRNGYGSRPVNDRDRDRDRGYGNRNEDKDYNRNDDKGYNKNDDKKYNNRNEDKGYNTRYDDKGYNKNDDKGGNNKNDDRNQGSYGRPSGNDRNKSGDGTDDKRSSTPNTKFDNRHENRPDDNQRGGNRDRYDDRDRDRDRVRDRDSDRNSDRDRYRPSNSPSHDDRGNGYDNRRPPPYDDRYDRRPAYDDDRYERRPAYNDDRYDRRPYYPEDRYERPLYPEDKYESRRPYYSPERDAGRDSGWQSYDRYGNRQSGQGADRPYRDRDYRPDSQSRYDDHYDDRYGYDNRHVDDRYSKQDSFRPWDETYRGTSGFDKGGRGYYFASGRPDVGASSSWGGDYDKGYATSWNYGTNRGGGGGGGSYYAGAVAGGGGWNDQSNPSGGWRRPAPPPRGPLRPDYLYDRPSSEKSTPPAKDDQEDGRRQREEDGRRQGEGDGRRQGEGERTTNEVNQGVEKKDDKTAETAEKKV